MLLKNVLSLLEPVDYQYDHWCTPPPTGASRECRKCHFLSARDNFLHLLIVISSTVVVGGQMQGTIFRRWQTLYPFFPMTI